MKKLIALYIYWSYNSTLSFLPYLQYTSRFCLYWVVAGKPEYLIELVKKVLQFRLSPSQHSTQEVFWQLTFCCIKNGHKPLNFLHINALEKWFCATLPWLQTFGHVDLKKSLKSSNQNFWSFGMKHRDDLLEKVSIYDFIRLPDTRLPWSH